MLTLTTWMTVSKGAIGINFGHGGLFFLDCGGYHVTLIEDVSVLNHFDVLHSHLKLLSFWSTHSRDGFSGCFHLSTPSVVGRE